MASMRASWFRRLLYRVTPWLFKTCPGDNKHWRWDKWCYCRCGEHSSDHHGGAIRFSDGTEWVLYERR